jgi:hypothetical protein
MKKTEKKKLMKKLVLSKETLRDLSDKEMMKEVVGGATQVSCMWACFATRVAGSNCVC